MTEFTILAPSPPAIAEITEWIEDNGLTAADYVFYRNANPRIARIELMISAIRSRGDVPPKAVMALRDREAADLGDDFTLVFTSDVHAVMFKMTFNEKVKIRTVEA